MHIANIKSDIFLSWRINDLFIDRKNKHKVVQHHHANLKIQKREKVYHQPSSNSPS